MKRIFTSLSLAVALACLWCPTVFAQNETATDTTIVIGNTGYLPVRCSRPFSGPENLLIININASNHSSTTDLRYNTWRADTVVAMATCYILVGQPGTYTLTYHDTATLKGSSVSYWTEASFVENTAQVNDELKKARIYKFINTAEKIGFQRDEKYAADGYNKCDFAEGEHFYIILKKPICNKIAAANGKTSFEDLDFITWHGSTPADIVSAITTAKNSVVLHPTEIYDLQGRRLNNVPSHGLYIQGKRKIVK
ncbi:MAG: hypothetical protein K5764_10435 [Prevotella sp.]|nr:hypothetical protein [Prevotella sp.]